MCPPAGRRLPTARRRWFSRPRRAARPRSLMTPSGAVVALIAHDGSVLPVAEQDHHIVGSLIVG
jgi:hypothetical protein